MELLQADLLDFSLNLKQMPGYLSLLYGYHTRNLTKVAKFGWFSSQQCFLHNPRLVKYRSGSRNKWWEICLGFSAAWLHSGRRSELTRRDDGVAGATGIDASMRRAAASRCQVGVRPRLSAAWKLNAPLCLNLSC